MEPLTLKSRCQATDIKETWIPEDSGCNSTFGTDNNPTTTIHKTGSLICKTVKDESARKTRKGPETMDAVYCRSKRHGFPFTKRLVRDNPIKICL